MLLLTLKHLQKLSSLQPHEMTKVAVLVLWIIELYLNQLGSLRDFGKKDTAEYRNMEDEFLQFMSQNTVKVNNLFGMDTPSVPPAS